jgi:hypothetical protein
MDQISWKSIFEVRTLCLAATVLSFGNMGAASAAECVPHYPGDCAYLGHTVPQLKPEDVPWVTELTGYQIDFIERAMRELRARRPDWMLYQIKIAQWVGSSTMLVAQAPGEPNGPHTLTIDVDQVTSQITVTEGPSDLIRVP